MRRWLITLLMVGSVGVVANAAEAATRTAATCSQADVLTEVNASSDGDTVIIPSAGGSCTWTGNLPIAKAITLKGTGCTYDADDRPTACETVIIDNAPDPGGSGRSAILSWTLVAGKNSRMTEIEFRGILHSGTAQAGAATTITLDTGASATDDFYNGLTIILTSGTGGTGQSRVISDYVGATKVATISSAWSTNPNSSTGFSITTSSQAYNGVITVTGATTDARRMRVDHNFFNDLNGVSVFSTTVLGVYDHNYFKKALTAGIFLYTYHTGWGGFTFSDGSMAAVVDYASEEWLFIEDNKFDRSGISPYAINDAYRGARYIVRNNDIINGWIELHGTDSGGRRRGARAVAVYGNSFSCVGATCSYGLNARSGTGVFEHNTFTGFTSPHLTLAAYRLFYTFSPWGPADGRSPWDINLGGAPFYTGTATGGGSMTMVDSGASFPSLAGYSVVRSSGCVGYCASVILSNTSTTLTYFDGGDYPDLSTRTVQASPAPSTTTATFNSAFAQIGDDIEIPCDSANVVRVTNVVGAAYTWTPAITAPSAGAVACLGDLVFRAGDPYAIYKTTETFDQPGRGQGTQLLARTMSGCTQAGFIATCTTNSAHSFSTGNNVAIADVTPSGYNGTFQITVTGASTFTYTALYSGLTSGDNNGTVTKLPATNDQVDEPWKECDNTQGATNINFSTTFGQQIRSGEHYLTDTCYGGSFYTYPHPLAVDDDPDPPAASGSARQRLRRGGA